MPNCSTCGFEADAEAAYCPQCGKPLENATSYTDFEYAAFISYRHLERDAAVAMRLQRYIEGFTVPSGLRQNGQGKKIGKLFRDEDELPASDSLSDQIRTALKKSRFLIVVCTPEMRESLWVQREVELFASFHGRNKVLMALASAEPAESFPELLLSKSVELPDGSIGIEPVEPIAADFRSKGSSEFKSEALRLVAALLGCGYDYLKQRHRARRNALIARIGCAVAVASLAFAGVVSFQQAQILEQQHDLEVSRSRYLANEIDGLINEGRRMEAVQVALAALPGGSEDSAQPYVPEARAALEKAMQCYPSRIGWTPDYSIDCSSDDVIIATSDASGLLSVIEGESPVVSTYRLADGEMLDRRMLQMNGAGLGGYDAVFNGDDLVVLSTESGAIACYNASDGSDWWEYKAGDNIDAAAMALSANESSIYQSHYGTDYHAGEESRFAAVVAIDAETGTEHARYDLPIGSEDYTTKIAVAEDDSSICASFGSSLALIDAATGAVVTVEVEQPLCSNLVWAGDAVVAASVDEMREGPVLCSVECFSKGGEKLWGFNRFMEHPAFQGFVFVPTIVFWDTYSLGDGRSRQILASFGNELLGISTSNGEVEVLGEPDSPATDCFIEEADNYTVLRVCTALGGVCDIPLSGVVPGRMRDDTLLPHLSDGCFVTNGSARFLVVVPMVAEEQPGRIAVYHQRDLYENASPVTDRSEFEEAATYDDLTPAERSVVDALVSKEGISPYDVSFALVDDERGQKAIVQTASQLMLFDTRSERLELCSIASFERIESGGFSSTGELFFARYPIPGDASGGSNLAIFDLTAEYLAPQSIVPFGVALSKDATAVLVDYPTTGEAVIPYPTLDELIAQAQKLSAGFELSDQEKAELFIDI